MRFTKVRLQNFRNIPFTGLEFAPERNFLLGPNGQGKSNLLEALGVVMALRSFRTQSTEALIRRGETELQAFYEIESSEGDLVELKIGLSGREKSILLDGERIYRMGDFLGQFPVVALSSGDLMLLRGSPADRRRFLDLTLSATDPEYYQNLRHYHRGLSERNRLLKNEGSDAELAAFESEVSRAAVFLCQRRAAGMEALSRWVVEIYANIAERDEGPALVYQPNTTCAAVEEYGAMLVSNRKRDRIIGSTQKGPHRDDFVFSLEVGGAKEFGSDGQQRGLCLALRLGQALYLREKLGEDPVLLADDVLGELDPVREAGFWKACPPEFQIIASGTQAPPDVRTWKLWKVDNGSFTQSE